MSEELLQRDLLKNPGKIGKWEFYNIGATTVRALKEYGIIRNVNYGNEEKKKVDGLIVQKKNVIAVIEYKKPSDFKTIAQKNKAIKQELEVARKLHAHIIIATDTKETVWVNVATGNTIKDENGKEIKTNFDIKDERLPELIEKIKFSINEINDQIKPKKLVNPTDLAKQIWQDIWSVSGATPENCLYTFVELFIFKYLSDLGVLQGLFSFNSLFESYNGNTEDEVLENYASVIRPKIKNLFPENPKDKTTIINGTIFVSKDQKAVKGYSSVFRKVLRKFMDYGKLEHIDYDFKSQLFESFLKESISKKNWGQFFTPLKVVRAVIEMAKDDIKEGIKICDPACGVGKFLLEPIATKLDQFYEIKQGELLPKITIRGYDKGFDKDEQKTIILAKANMLIYFSDLIKDNPNMTKEFAKLFNDSFLLKTNSILGTLSEPVENEYDLILTNPPYVTSGSSNLKDEIKKDGSLVGHYKINAVGVEGLFMEWIIKALKPNGKAYIIVPDGVFTRQNDKNLRQFIVDECFIDAIISLPLKTFFTTIKKTYILCITKKQDKTKSQNTPIFNYLVSEIGESRDVYRFDIDKDDLLEAVKLFSFFKGNKSCFSSFNTDPRCKIMDVKTFVDSIDSSWDIDKFWDKNEKISLGVIDENKIVKIQEFPQILEEVNNTIKCLQQQALDIDLPPKANFKKVCIKDIFDITSGNSKLTKDYIDKNKGKYVVYSANTKENGVFGYLNNFDHNTECIQITTNGVYAGTVFYREKHKFSINGDARLLIKKDKNLDYKYLTIELKKAFTEHNFNWENKPTITKIKNIELNVPVKNTGIYDLDYQIQISDKCKKIEQIKKNISLELEKISKTEIDF
ncbi:MAG: N-6 DNA methylase [Clostridia bacterium]|nr:N-6 DNA methylase [Clostridia bacterium]